MRSRAESMLSPYLNLEKLRGEKVFPWATGAQTTHGRQAIYGIEICKEMIDCYEKIDWLIEWPKVLEFYTSRQGKDELIQSEFFANEAEILEAFSGFGRAYFRTLYLMEQFELYLKYKNYPMPFLTQMPSSLSIWKGTGGGSLSQFSFSDIEYFSEHDARAFIHKQKGSLSYKASLMCLSASDGLSYFGLKRLFDGAKICFSQGEFEVGQIFDMRIEYCLPGENIPRCCPSNISRDGEIVFDANEFAVDLKKLRIDCLRAEFEILDPLKLRSGA